MIWKKQSPSPNPPDVPEAFVYKSVPLRLQLWGQVTDWINEYTPLAEAFCIAVSLHVLFFPMMWFAGWALPWPKGPSFTTIIEINLENWPEDASPERIEQIYTRALKNVRPRNK